MAKKKLLYFTNLTPSNGFLSPKKWFANNEEAYFVVNGYFDYFKDPDADGSHCNNCVEVKGG